MSTKRTIADVIGRTLTDRGFRFAYGIPGVHNLPFWDSDDGLHVVGVRHEQSAVYAADGLFRATGEPAAAYVTSGPGAANTAAAFGEAFMCGSAVVVVASEVNASARSPHGPRGILHEMADQSAIFAAFGAPSYSAFTDDEAVTNSARAIDAAITVPTGPSAVNVATDVLGHESSAAVPARNTPMPPSPTTAQLRSLVELLNSNEKVVLWVGGGVVSADAEAELIALAERLNAPIVTTYAAKGIAAGHPLLVDAPVHEPETAELIAGADALLGVGSAFDGMNTRNWKMPIPAVMAAICLGEQVTRTFHWDLLLQTEVRATLDALLSENTLANHARWCEPSAIRPTLVTRLAADPRTAEAIAFVELVSDAWPTEGVVVCDMAVSAYWFGGYASQPRPRRMQYAVGWGTLGYAMPAAIGPASAGMKTLVVCGDGGPMFALGELATYAQERLPITMLVNDDGGYGMLRFDQRTFGHPERGVDLLTPDWFALGAAFEITVTEAHSPEELPALISDAAAAHEPRIVVHRAQFHPPRTTSPRWFE